MPTMPQPTTVKEMEIPRLMHDVEDEISLMIEEINRLKDRLAPVSRVAAPLAEVPVEDKPPIATPIGKWLVDTLRVVRRVKEEILEICNRLEL